MAKVGGIARASLIPRMKAARAAGQSASRFIADMRKAGLSYRRTTMLADWRNVGNIEKKTGLLRYVRKDFIPSAAIYAQVDWDLSREYLYKLRVDTRLRPGEPITERFVNIVSDKPMTPREIEQEVLTSWGDWYAETRGQIVTITPELAVHKATI